MANDLNPVGEVAPLAGAWSNLGNRVPNGVTRNDEDGAVMQFEIERPESRRWRLSLIHPEATVSYEFSLPESGRWRIGDIRTQADRQRNARGRVRLYYSFGNIKCNCKPRHNAEAAANICAIPQAVC